MPTSLQKQLAVIAAASSHQIDLKTQRNLHSQSLLFEPAIAVSQDFHTIFQVCREGYEELCSLDSRFTAFSGTLFHEQSKFEERSSKTLGEINNLDSTIENFLTLISSRLLLNPALKALDWLIRRFRIHEHNTESVLHAFLPYHTSRNFQLLLAILPEKLPNNYVFLRPYISSRSNPSRHTIISYSIRNPPFPSAYSQFVIAAAKRRQTSTFLTKFWAGFLTQSIDGQFNAARSGRGPIQRQREEDILLRVIPQISDALSVSESAEMTRGCLMLIFTLVSKADLNDHVLSTFADAVAQNLVPEVIEDCLICLSAIFNEKLDLEIPTSIMTRFENPKDFMAVIEKISTRTRVDRLCLGYLLAYLRMDHVVPRERLNCINAMISREFVIVQQLPIILPKVIDIVNKTEELGQNDKTYHTELMKLTKTLSAKSQDIEMSTLLKDFGLCQASFTGDTDLPKSEMGAQSAKKDARIELNEQSDDVYLRSLLQQLNAGSRAEFSYFSVPTTLEAIAQDLVSTISASADPLGNLEELLQLQTFDSSEKSPSLNYMSFLLRLSFETGDGNIMEWCWNNMAVAISSCVDKYDFQALYPYIAAALTNEIKKVRQAASNCIQSLRKIWKTGKLRHPSLWGSSLYAHDVDQMTSDQSQKILLNIFSQIMEECVIDHTYIIHAFESRLSKHHNEEDARIDSDVKVIKGATRAAFITMLGSHVTATPLLAARCKLIFILDRLGKLSAGVRAQYLTPIAQSWFDKSSEEVSRLCREANIRVEEANRAHLVVLDGRDDQNFDFLKNLIKGEFGDSRIIDDAFQQLRNVWLKLSTMKRQVLASLLLDICLDKREDPPSRARSSKASEVLKELKFSSDVITHLMESMSSPIHDNRAIQRGTKRRRTSRSDISRVEVFDQSELMEYIRKVTAVLEIVEISYPGDKPRLLKGLFRVIEELQILRLQIGSDNVYLQTLALDSLLSIVKGIKSYEYPNIDTSAIRTDLLVECIRNSSNARVQSTALLIISSLAEWAPELVLHSVMPIFTFMGSTLLRQSDDYSAHVVDQTISHVIPPLLSSLRKGKKNFLSGIAELLLSFAAAYEHIPSNRRLDIFSQLVFTLDSDECFAAMVAILFDKYSEDSSLPNFVAKLAQRAQSSNIFGVLTQYEIIVRDTLGPNRKYSDVFFSFNEKSGTQIAHTQLCLLSLLAKFLNESRLGSSRTASLTESEQILYAKFFSNVINLRQALTSSTDSRKACERVLSASLAIITFEELILTAEKLLKNSMPEVRRTLLKAIESRLNTAQIRNTTAATAIRFISTLESIISDSNDESEKVEALICLQKIAKSFGKTDISTVLHALDILSGETVLLSPVKAVRKATIECLQAFVSLLRDELVPFLPALWPKIFGCLKESMMGCSAIDATLHLLAYGLMSTILDFIPYSLSGNNLIVAIEYSHMSASFKFGTNNGPAVDEARINFLLRLGKLASHECFNAVESTWSHALSTGYFSCAEHMEILVHTLVTSCSKSVLTQHSKQLFKLFVNAFYVRKSLRKKQPSLFKELEIARIEGHLIDVVMKMTLRLNDTSFRPFFVQLAEVAVVSTKSPITEETIYCATTFFKFLGTFFRELKSHVTGYSSYVLENASNILKIRSNTADMVLLKKEVHQALRSSFEYDEEEYWLAPSHFTTLAESLLDELSFCSTDLCVQEVIPTITELAIVAASSNHHKEINSRLTKYLKPESDVRTRLMAVKCEKGLTERLGEDWLTLLPEMLPIMNELLEADDEETEEASRSWMRRIEEILGTSIDTMLQ